MENKKQQENEGHGFELDDQHLDTVSGGGLMTDILGRVKKAGQQALQGAGTEIVQQSTNKVIELLRPKQ